MTQPYLVDQILGNLNIREDVTPKPTPYASSKLLSRNSNSKDFDNSSNYLSVIGNINYMGKGSRSYIKYITHQCAIFSTCPNKEHAESILWLDRYLKVTKDKGKILRPFKERVLEAYVDADFAGNWDAK